MSVVQNAESEKRVCPNCGEGDYSGIEVRGIYDGVLIWVCNSCGHRWPRFNPPGRLYDYAVLMIEKDNV